MGVRVLVIRQPKKVKLKSRLLKIKQPLLRREGLRGGEVNKTISEE